MDLLTQTALIASVMSFGLGVSVISRNTRNTLFIVFTQLCAVVSGWSLFFVLDRIWPGMGFYRVHILFHMWLAPSAIWLIRMMIRLEDAFIRRLISLALFSAFVGSSAMAVGWEVRLHWMRIAVAFMPSFISIAVIYLIWMDSRSPIPEPAARGRFAVVGLGKRNSVYLGALGVVGLANMDHFEWLGTFLPSIGNLAIVGFLFFVSQAITHQRLLNFGALLSRTLVLLAVALTFTGVYTLLVAWIQDNPALFFLNSFLASFLLLILLDPIRTFVGYVTQKLLSKKQQRLVQILREAQTRLAGTVDMGALFQSIMLTTEQVLSPEWGALFVLRPDGTRYRRVRVTGPEPTSTTTVQVLREILADHPLFEYCLKQQKRGELPILLDQLLENEIERSASRSQREVLTGLLQGMKAMSANLLIPLYDSVNDRILGFVTLKISAPPEPWGNNWGLLQILYPYYLLAAQSLRSMEVFVRSREKERLATLGEMAAGLAHEIRNPLGAIKGAAQLLDPDPQRADANLVRVIIEEVNRLNRVVTQFLDYSKPQGVELKPVVLEDILTRTVESVSPGIPANIKFQRLNGLPTLTQKTLQVLASSEQIQQVLVNFFQNSVKAITESAAESGGIQSGAGVADLRPLASSADGNSSGLIKMETELSPDGAEVSVSVEDNGAGIKRENLDKLFIPFFTTTPSGTGLGLSICQKIAEAHRGRIEVQSEEGKFARFSLILPVHRGSL